ncbi:glycosyltransferase [Neobacillus sp. PS3-40]|uniref:glycosyltransferase family 2 protein n=1 Tax=Neobacillus sp. PS3-40 TaxID=3070679 RepID=UPI0027E06A2E|nr:glycosyltransferase [Neobacillus sp. PS3-40]WML45812.1 glycosyltransferase [Neobacillus sp. PS3-40]
MKLKISIIVPIYKVESFLHKCINSILAQTFTDFELILVNDGSPDKCGSICDQYAKTDDRIKVIHKQNGGLSSARNAGIEVAKGEYISFIDGDDYIDEEMFEILYHNAIIHSSDVIVCDFEKVTEDENHQKTKCEKEYSVQHFTNIQALHQLYDPKISDRDKWVIACNKLYKRYLFNGSKFEEGKIFEDEFIAHKVLYDCKKITIIPEKLYYYVQRSNSIVGSPFSTKKFDRVYALKERAHYFRTIKQYNLYYLAQRHFMDVFLWYYYKAKSDITDGNKELKTLKKKSNMSLVLMLRNPLISWKQKVLLVSFVINPSFYSFIINWNKE